MVGLTSYAPPNSSIKYFIYSFIQSLTVAAGDDHVYTISDSSAYRNPAAVGGSRRDDSGIPEGRVRNIMEGHFPRPFFLWLSPLPY